MNLKEAIRSKGIKQTWLAQQIGVSEVTMSNWVSQKSRPKPLHLQKLSEMLNVSISNIINIK